MPLTPTRKQPLDATLTALAGVTVAADQLIYATGADAFAATGLTSFGRSLIDDAAASNARTTLGLVIGADVAAQSSLASYLPLAGGTLTGAGTIYGVGGTSARLVLSQSAGAFLEYGSSSLTIGGPMIFTDGGVERLRFTSSGLLGIGTSIGGGLSGMIHIVPNSASERGIYIKGAASQSANYLEIVDSSSAAIFSVTAAGVGVMSAQLRLKGYTVATLPAGTQGDTAFVTDALAPTFLVTVAGGGGVVTTVFYNGTNWVAQ